MQIQTTMRYHLHLLGQLIKKKSVSENVEKRKPWYTIGGSVNWYDRLGKQYGRSFKKLILELPYDPAIPLLGIYAKRIEISISKIYLYFLVHCSTSHNR